MTQRGHLKFRTGDATAPKARGTKIIAHVCSDLGRWGKGFVLALSDRWPATQARYTAWHRGEEASADPFKLGAVQFVEVDRRLWVANMIGQHRITNQNGVPPVRYDAIEKALEKVAAFAVENNASVHMPRIGCGLAGGTWDRIQPLIENAVLAAGVDVTVYDLPAPTERPIDEDRWNDYGEHM